MMLIVAGPLFIGLTTFSPRTSHFQMDTPSALLPRDGLREVEHFADRPGIYRWSNGHAVIHLPNPGGHLTFGIILAGGPGRTVPATIQTKNASYHLQIRPEPHLYTLILPPQQGERYTVHLESPLVDVANQDLGIVVSDIQITGDGALSWQIAGLLVLATLGAYLALRQAGASPLIAACGGIVFEALIASWQAAGGWRYGVAFSILGLISGACFSALILNRFHAEAADEGQKTLSWTGRDTITLLALLVIALGIRSFVLTAPDPVGDLEISARRMGFLHSLDLAGAYQSDGDYMPLRLYILYGLSAAVLPLGGSFTAPLPTPTLLLIKLPSLLADLITTAMLYGTIRRWSRGLALGLTALYVCSPPIWLNVAWWGQVDALLILPLLATVVLLDRADGRWSWICWTLALLIKPQAIILAPLLFAATIRLHGTRGIVQGGILAISLFVVGSLPLIVAGQGPGLLQAYLGSVGRFPLVTNGAYNLWYLLTWAEQRDLGTGVGPFSFDTAGMLLMAAVAALVGISLLRRADLPVRAQGATILMLAFFLLPTQIHERYLVLSFAFLLVSCAAWRMHLAPYLVLVVTATLNILGTLRGFAPAIYPLLFRSPLTLGIAVINLATLVFLAIHLVIVSFRSAPFREQPTPPRQQHAA